ncbi:TPA: hypothetical protein VJS59_001583 [Streptococcus pyogenes]|uniref:hypothetical protein n=1 Tax=unclassified Peribacillus TaxID=2675266 RepID=UPI002B3D103E|nr:hypothetical protein [Streptococcus pyogenes]HER2169411.1 hypothetical protein [Streptococcus pyogenes]HER2174367.1 hypothetical protein [Streptococcus pyogenes]
MDDSYKKATVNVQDLISQDMFEKKDSGGNDMLEVLQFTKENGVPLTEDQVKAWFLLNENGLEDIALFANAVRPQMTPMKKIFDMVNKITMADRIRGTAKLDKILKASVSNPNQSMPSANDVQAKALKEKDLH